MSARARKAKKSCPPRDRLVAVLVSQDDAKAIIQVMGRKGLSEELMKPIVPILQGVLRGYFFMTA